MASPAINQDKTLTPEQAPKQVPKQAKSKRKIIKMP